MTNISLKLLDFEFQDKVETIEEENDYGKIYEKKDRSMTIKMFGLDEAGKTYCIHVENYEPFFYIMVPDNWTISKKNIFEQHLNEKLYLKGLIDCKLIKRHKLYGFDAGKEHKFIMLKFNNITEFNKTKYLWYKELIYCRCHKKLFVYNKNYMKCPDCNHEYDEEKIKEYSKRQIIDYQMVKNGDKLKIYESTIPPLLRFFHIKEISPSGWIKFPKNKAIEYENVSICDHEYTISEKYIKPDNKETGVPYKICSFDIEASSSHGDFPVPKKTYRKLVIDILDYFNLEKETLSGNSREDNENLLNKYYYNCF